MKTSPYRTPTLLAGTLSLALSLAHPSRAQEPEPKRGPGERPRPESAVPRDPDREPRRAAPPRREEDLPERRAESAAARGGELEALNDRFRGLVAAGRMEEAEQVKRRLDELDPRPGARTPQAPSPGAVPEERERRVRHLLMAAENLHAAGVHDLAVQIQRQAEQLQRMPHGSPTGGSPGASGPRPGAPGAPGQPFPGQPGPNRPEFGGAGPQAGGDELPNTVRHLQAAVQELREQVQAMRYQLESRKR